MTKTSEDREAALKFEKVMEKSLARLASSIVQSMKSGRGGGAVMPFCRFRSRRDGDAQSSSGAGSSSAA
jgi:hypothetical protein